MNDIQKDILLYWSGEADAITKQRVKDRLEHDPEARAYLSELKELNSKFRSSQKNSHGKAPTRRQGLLDEILNKVAQEKVTNKDHETSPFRWSLFAAVAACFAMLAIAIYHLVVSNHSNLETTALQSSSNQVKVEHRPHDNRMTLSQRLLERTVSFRRNGGGLIAMRSNRERQEKIRTKNHNK